MDPKELIAALGVVADPNASPEGKAEALDKLSAYFNSLLDSQSQQDQQAASETAKSTTESESASEAGNGDDKEKDESAKEAASALAGALEQVKALTDRVAKMEKASAIVRAPRVEKPTVIQRAPAAAAPMDPQSAVTISMIEKAAKNTIGMLGK